MSPLSQSQLGIFYACQEIDEKSGNYQIPALWQLPQSVDVLRLKDALEQVVKNHTYILSKIVMQDETVMMESVDYSDDVVELKSVQSIDDVRGTFCRTMDLMHDRLFRMEIYTTPSANYLYMDFHHIIMDGAAWMGVLLPEIDKAYRGEQLSTEILTGDDIANEELFLRQSDTWQTERDWYLNEFADAEDLDSMPTQSYIDRDDDDRGLVETIFPVSITQEALTSICEKYGVKESVVFTAAWGKLLANYTAEDKAFFATIFTGRSDIRTRQAITMMVHTMPVFMQMRSDMTIAEWLQTVRTQQKNTREKSAYSYADLHQDLGVRSDIIFAYHGKVVSASTAHLTIDGQTIDGDDLRIARPGITLDGQVMLATNAIDNHTYDLRISYQSAIYSADIIAEMADAYGAILQSMATVETVGQLAAASEKQITWLDKRNPETLAEYSEHITSIDLFRENAKKFPRRECCVFEDNRYTYGQIDALTDALASQIQEKISRSHDAEPPVVSFIVPRNELMVIVPLAIVKAGCTYQPLDSSYPKERLNFMINDAEAQLFIRTEEFESLIDDYTGETMVVDVPMIQKMQISALNKLPALTPDDTAFLLYTSGTTGTPKGVMLSHRNIMVFALNHAKLQQMDENCRVATYASYGFDAYQQDLWVAMVSGAALCIISEDIRYDLTDLHDFLLKEHITHTFMTTQVGTQMAINYPDIPDLRVFYVGGEKLVSIDPPRYRFVNGYGPTETTVYVACYEVNKNEKNIPIGYATDNTRLYVVNKDLQRVPMGAAGELLVSGLQTTKGYLGQPEKTAASFIDNPFTDGTPCMTKAYRTGDIVRYREDGALEFIGRKDGQVKIRGFRIELKEVESVIRDYPGITNATVQAFDLEAGGKAIAAYIVAEEQIDTQSLNAFIAAQKPPYMVPAVTMQIEEIPLNVNGKVDKKKLPKAVMTATTNGDAQTNQVAAPLNLLEKELVDMVSTISGCQDISITTPLQYIGLTSISIIKLSAQLYKHFGINIPNKVLMHDATIQLIENKILEQLLSPQEQTHPQPAVTIDTPSRSRSCPLSNAQLGVYYECLKNPESTAYNVPTIITFPTRITSEQIKSAVEKAIEAHPLLLAHFDNSADPTLQKIDDAVRPVVVISEQTVDELKQNYIRPFDLSRGPLYRATVSGNSLLLDVHHLVMDGSSLSILVRDICRSLDEQDVEPETYTFFDYAEAENATDSSVAEAYFESQLSTVDEATSLPADLHGNEQEGRAAYAHQVVDHDSVEAFARTHGVTPASVYLAAIEYLAARYGNTKDVCICTVSSGRSNVKTSDTVGMFVNTLALVSHISDKSVDAYIHEVAENFTRTLENENYPFAKISERFGIDAGLVFVYEVGVIEKFTVRDELVTTEQMELSAPKFKVTILVEEYEGNICFSAEYNDALYSADMIRRMLESLNQVLNNMLSNPDKQITNLSIVSPSQQAELSTMNSIGTAPLPVRLFHRGMELWAEKEPERIALIATDNTLTYGEFNKEANRIANALIKKGIKKGDAVVVLLPRNSHTICCIFGIMKAGGAFIPCDPEYPTERIQLIAEDSGAPYVVTTQPLVGNYGKRGVLIDDLIAETDDTQPDVEVLPTDLAYYIYTSGSTGKPKGVRVAHYNITTFVTTSPSHPMRAMMEVCERLCSVSTISFDASICEYGMALFNGRTFIFSNEEESKDPLALLSLIICTQPDYFGCTSSRMLQYMELPEFLAYMKNFKCILQGGEKFSDILLARLREVTNHCVLLNGYGPTEISIGCNSADLQNAKYLTVGKPLPNYTEWIIDKDGNELPVGVTGELCVGGEGVTQGYNNLPEKTAEKFITYRGMRAFKTGDYARWLSNGEVEILGRTDNQVKLRGLRIELGEVESVITQQEGVKNVLVKICNIQGRDHLSAYFVADHQIDINALKQTISRTLTAYMVPTAYLQMDSFPITPNGKIDFRNLPEPLLIQSSSEYVAPANATEKFFADTFAQVLGLDRVSATESFFDVGGTSLVVMKVVIALQKEGHQVKYADVFAHPTPRQLAAFVGNGQNQEQDPDADIKDFDYTNIDNQLKRNTLERFRQDSTLRPLGNVLLTGATGFLGIHVLKCLIEQYPDSTIHCLLRPKRGVSAEERLRQLLFYYFEMNLADLFGKRIFVHEGDVTSPITLSEPIDTVMNCAAIVKHFSKGTEIEDVNVGGVRNCIDFCLKANARLIQVSTYSVAGAAVNGVPDVEVFNEQMLYVGQQIHNQYIHSKIMGERLLLEAVATQGLDGKIMRVGNLSARSEDGEFQINLKTNSFMGRLRIYQMLGAVPYSAYQSPVEFSPIDQTATAICLLSQTNNDCTVFHPYNIHPQMLGDILKEMHIIGKTVNLVEDEQFVDIMNVAKSDADKQERLSAMLAYENNDTKDFIRMIPASGDYTMQVLLRLGFRWDPTSWNYVDQFLRQIDGLRFFDL